MKAYKTEIIEFELNKLQEITGIIGIVIANRNGLLITSRLPRDIDGRKLGAMAATMFEAIEIATSKLGDKKIYNVAVEFDDFQIISLGISDQMIFISLMDININIGLVLIEIEESIENIKRYS
jgi:predicted regulator of Ras-like GTPase activity (Roadblock/LC7/MglB family)